MQKTLRRSNLAFCLGRTNENAHGAVPRNNQLVLMDKRVYLSGQAHPQLQNMSSLENELMYKYLLGTHRKLSAT